MEDRPLARRERAAASAEPGIPLSHLPHRFPWHLGKRLPGGEHGGCRAGAFPVLLWQRWQTHMGPDSPERCWVLGTAWIKMLLNLINWV